MHPGRALVGLIVAAALFALPTSALAARQQHRPATPPGSLQQLSGKSGCLADRSKPIFGCTLVRALHGPAPFLGSEAIAASPDGKTVYVASSKSNAIAIFKRNSNTGELTQQSGTAGCIAERGREGCARANGLRGPNSVAVSPNGRNVYATSVGTDSITVFQRNPETGALRQSV